MKKLRDDFVEQAEAEGEVEVRVSYDIIRQFSMQLYTNPRKAIEELVCNSYDAGATRCDIRIPHSQAEALIVLDDGVSMDFEGLEGLWQVAVSPKSTPAGEPRIQNNRAQIGKFGVGKLAAFALGGRLTHISKKDGEVRIISVGQTEIKDQAKAGRPKFTVHRLPEDEAKPIIEPYLDGLPNPWTSKWKSWTLAIVEEIDEGNFGRALKIGYLRRMIRTSIPISARFEAYLEGDLIKPRKIEKEDIIAEIDVTSGEFKQRAEAALRAFWAANLEEEEGNIPTEKYTCKVEKIQNPQNTTEKVSALIVPDLGAVIGSAIIARDSLATAKLEERGYEDNGFRVYVHGKLINPEDPLFGISQRSHRFWIRFLAKLEIPELDDALLVQRNAVSENNLKTLLAREIVKALFNLNRTKAEEKESEEEEEEYAPRSFGSRLKRLSPFLAPLALTGLVDEQWPDAGIEGIGVEYVTLGQDDEAVRFNAEQNIIEINDEHPLLVAISEIGPAGHQLRTVIAEILAATMVARGYLRAQGVADQIMLDFEAILEDAFRSAAGYVRDEVEEHIQAIDEESFVGGTPFEKAVVEAFRSLRLSARHIGGSNLPDGVISIPRAGQPNLLISVEAKGGKGIITHAVLRTSTVDRHRGDLDCEHSVAIAREFQLEGKGDAPSALVREAEGLITLLVVNSIAKILRRHNERPFTYDRLAEILTSDLLPEELDDFIDVKWLELPDTGLIRDILEVAHELMDKDAMNYPDPGMIAGDQRIRDRGISRNEIAKILEVIALGTGRLIIRNHETHEFVLLASPEDILQSLLDSREGGQPE
ncbi:MAG: ATP-binding protein [Anaerolineales bacterium]